MNLKIKNFAKIHVADIDINGITVIAGNNDTGKSTVGKVLCSVFDSLYNIDESVEQAKNMRIYRAIREPLEKYMDSPAVRFSFVRNADSASAHILSTNDSVELKNIISEIVDTNFTQKEKNKDAERIQRLKEEVFHSVLSVKEISQEQYTKSILSLYFLNIFNNQVNNISHRDLEASVQLRIKSRNLKFNFIDNQLQNLEQEVKITNSATYIENPYILDQLNERDDYASRRYRGGFANLNDDLYQKLYHKDVSDVHQEAIDNILISEKLKNVVNEINEVMPGKIIYNKNDYVYTDVNGNVLNINSLSTGLKSFAVIKQLLSNSSIKDNDVLVLDEPEIHLHPEWQLRYAQIIVLLQKAFNLNIVLTTHSSHFVESIDLYSQVYKIKDRCTYYLACNEDGMSVFENVTKDMRPIYKSLVQPSLLIEQLEHKYGISEDE